MNCPALAKRRLEPGTQIEVSSVSTTLGRAPDRGTRPFTLVAREPIHVQRSTLSYHMNSIKAHDRRRGDRIRRSRLPYLGRRPYEIQCAFSARCLVVGKDVSVIRTYVYDSVRHSR